MLNKKGFTLIESLLVISIMIIISTLTLTFNVKVGDERKIIDQVECFINDSKLNAMRYKKKTTLQFDQNAIYYNDGEHSSQLQLPKQFSFEKYSLTWNSNGNIKTAKRVSLTTNKHVYSFVFQVGSGSYYVQ